LNGLEPVGLAERHGDTTELAAMAASKLRWKGHHATF
jgi:hypothetical protein